MKRPIRRRLDDKEKPQVPADGEAQDAQDEEDLGRKGPERSCIVTRLKTTPDNLLRFVLGPDGSVVPDIRGKLPGRGAWVKPEAKVVAEALRRKSFARAFKAEVSVQPDLVEAVAALLERDALSALSIANKAGLLLTGAAKIEAALGKRTFTTLVHAADGSQDGRRKLEASIRRRLGDATETLIRVQIFRSSQLDLALGRTNVIHAALAAGMASDGFVSRSRRLEHYRGSAQIATVGFIESAED